MLCIAACHVLLIALDDSQFHPIDLFTLFIRYPNLTSRNLMTRDVSSPARSVVCCLQMSTSCVLMHDATFDPNDATTRVPSCHARQ